MPFIDEEQGANSDEPYLLNPFFGLRKMTAVP
jgi:hypothetical protein